MSARNTNEFGPKCDVLATGKSSRSLFLSFYSTAFCRNIFNSWKSTGSFISGVINWEEGGGDLLRSILLGINSLGGDFPGGNSPCTIFNIFVEISPKPCFLLESRDLNKDTIFSVSKLTVSKKNPFNRQ